MSELRSTILNTFAVFASFFAFAAVQAPSPSVNEPHYLTKARNYWQPEWCARDFFLASPDAHPVFFQTVGALTRRSAFERAAHLSRIAAILVLAAGWCAMVRRVAPGLWSPLWAAWLFLGFAAVGNLSGEWIVGGVEAKVISYGLLFLGVAWAIDGRTSPRACLAAAAALGLSVSFHPVVGVWGVLSLAFAWIAVPIIDGRTESAGLNRSELGVLRFFGPAVIFAGASLWGLIPALRLITAPDASITATESLQADAIQVYYRLGHHLDPNRFSTAAFLGYSVLIVVWLAGGRRLSTSRGARLFAWFVVGAVLIAAAGLVIGLRPASAGDGVFPVDLPLFALRTKLLKFYPFRLADVMLPAAAAVTATSLAVRGLGVVETNPEGNPLKKGSDPGWERVRPLFQRTPGPATAHTWPGWLAFGTVFVFALLMPNVDRNPSRLEPEALAHWKSACTWIKTETPDDALFLTPTRSWAFKWYAQRAEYVCFKDCPQNTAGILEWNRRLLELRLWRERQPRRGSSRESVAELVEQTGATHILMRSDERFVSEPPIYRNDSWKIYKLPQ